MIYFYLNKKNSPNFSRSSNFKNFLSLTLLSCSECVKYYFLKIEVAPNKEVGLIPQKKDQLMTNYSESYQKCQHLTTIIKPHPYHAAGEYCADCGKWLRWVSKKEYKIYSENHHNSLNNLNNEEVA